MQSRQRYNAAPMPAPLSTSACLMVCLIPYNLPLIPPLPVLLATKPVGKVGAAGRRRCREADRTSS